MKKNNITAVLITSLVILLPMIIGFIMWGKLPDEIATHFDTNGVANRYDSKLFTIVGIPLILLAVHLLGAFSNRSNFEKAGNKMSVIILWLCPLISLVVMMSIYAKALNSEFNITYIAMILIAFITIFIGNYLPTVKQNSTIGIKIPSTLRNETNWYKTHRFAGKLWVAMGFIMLITAFMKFNLLYVIISWITVVLIVPIIYSCTIKEN